MAQSKRNKSQVKKEIKSLLSNKTINQVSGYYTKGKFGRVPNKSSGLRWNKIVNGRVYNVYELFKDTTFAACYQARSDAVFVNGIDFKGNKRDIKLLEEMNFYEEVMRLYGELVKFNINFTQVIKSNGKLSEVRTYDTVTMDFAIDDLNNVVGYYQILDSDLFTNSNTISRKFWDYALPESPNLDTNEQDKFFFFNKEEMFHYSINQIDSSLFPVVINDTLYRAVRLKFLILEYFSILFEENQFQSYINIPPMADKDKRIFMKNIIDAKKDKAKSIILEGYDVKLTDRREMQFLTYLINLFDRMDDEVMKGMRCKRIETTTSAEGRADNVVVKEFVYMRAKQDQNYLKRIIEKNIFKLGNIDVTIHFRVNVAQEKEVIQNLTTLGSIQPLNSDKMLDYLLERGVIVPEGIFIDPTTEEIQNQSDKNGSQNASRRELTNKDKGKAPLLTATREEAKKENLNTIFNKNK